MLEAVSKDPKKVLRGVGETVVTLKEMFTDTKGERYCEKLHDDLCKAIPKWARMHKSLEQMVVEKLDCQVTNAALSMNLDQLYNGYNDLAQWHVKFFGSKKKRKALL